MQKPGSMHEVYSSPVATVAKSKASPFGPMRLNQISPPSSEQSGLGERVYQ
jgi:hypothetical protein